MGKQHSAISRRSPDISAKRRHQDIGLKRCCLCKYVDHIAPLRWNSPLLSRSVELVVASRGGIRVAREVGVDELSRFVNA